ncbi:MAG: fluoride efflux transporter CrcB [Acidimicrobiia bacterium]|nr:fluoride efflux transporter CrcB [Acidimicrobiia bacterium]
MRELLAVALGGAVGAVARYGLTGVMHRAFPGPFPAGTLTVNIVGGLIVGFLSGVLVARDGGADHAFRLFLVVGVCGGFTTFSALSLETVHLMEAGATTTAWLSVAAQVVGAVLATALGLWIAQTVRQ